MRPLHAVVGWTTLLVFLGTGAYMRAHQPPLAELEMDTRLLFRSRHIYLLAAALVHLALSTSAEPVGPRWLRGIGVALLLVAPMLLLTAFFLETSTFGAPTPLSIYGVQSLLAGVLVLVVASWLGARRGPRTQDQEP